jgi:mono/diheme cytochrome c family protein
MTLDLKRSLLSALLVAGAMLVPAVAGAQEHTQTITGREVFKQYCVACHGTSARGDGPLATSMLHRPANLTEIAKRNGGQFPVELVFQTIDGRRKVRGHGGPDMPEWAEAFSKSRDAGDSARVEAIIQSLVDYLGSIQSTAAPGQQ